MSTHRYFERGAGRSKKFWSVVWQDRYVTVRSGRVGTAGDATAQVHPSVVEANIDASGRIENALAKGFREKKPPVARGGFGALPNETLLLRGGAPKPGWEKKILKVTGLARVPPSYLEYMQILERAAGDWVRARKHKVLPNYLEVYSDASGFVHGQKMLRIMLDMVEEYFPAATIAKWRRLIIFGTDGSRGFVCWDPTRIDRRGEPAIVLLDNYSDLRVRPLAKDLYELMRNYQQKIASYGSDR